MIRIRALQSVRDSEPGFLFRICLEAEEDHFFFETEGSEGPEGREAGVVLGRSVSAGSESGHPGKGKA